VQVGSEAPIVVQSMTNTDTADIASSVKQIAQLWRAGSEIVRVTVNNLESAKALPHIADKLAMMGVGLIPAMSGSARNATASSAPSLIWPTVMKNRSESASTGDLWIKTWRRR
jgi:hypothetical protein